MIEALKNMPDVAKITICAVLPAIVATVAYFLTNRRLKQKDCNISSEGAD